MARALKNLRESRMLKRNEMSTNIKELKTIYLVVTLVVRISKTPLEPVAFDTHARVVVSKLYDATNMQTKKTRPHFSRVSFGEIL